MRKVIRSYDLHEKNGIRWYRLNLAPLDFLVDPGIWLYDTRVGVDKDSEYPDEERVREMRSEGVGMGPYRVKLLAPRLYFDHGAPPWFELLRTKLGRPTG
jgi:hypothetical protein